LAVEDFDPAIDDAEQKTATAELLIAAAIATAATAATPAAVRQAVALASAYLEALAVYYAGWIALHVPMIYRSGVEEAYRAVEGYDQERLRAEADKAMQGRQREAYALMAEGLRADLDRLVRDLDMDTNRALREIRRRNVEKALARGNPVGQAPQMAREMREEGVKFTDRRGRRWKASKYARMTLLTHTAVILNAGNLNTAIELGSPGVVVSDGGPGDVDEPCERASGQTWSLPVAVANPIQHPNCRRAFAPLPRSWRGELDRA
jgi:hypothetical protein